MYKFPPPDYDRIEKDAWKESQSHVRDEALQKQPRLLKRIATFIDRFQYSEDHVLQKVIEDEMFAANFAKEPRRTSFHENIAAKWIDNLPFVDDFVTLPKGGNRSIKITSDGNLQSEMKGKSLPGKSLDFYWRSGKYKCYAMHKFTKEGGGNQDSQYKEMIELMRRFLLCDDNDVILFVIVDGEYYQQNDQKKLRELKKLEKHGSPCSFAISIADLPEKLQDLLEN